IELAQRLEQIYSKCWRVAYDPVVAWSLRSEYSQLIAVEAALAVLRQFAALLRVIIDQRAPVARAALGIAKCVDVERHPVSDAERLQDAVPERDDLDIGLRLRDAQQLDADLMKLAETPLLRPLIAEHRAGIAKFDRRRLRQPVRQDRANDPGGVLRPQCDLFAAAIVEGVHLLRDNVGVLADRPRKDLGKFENRRRDLGKPVKPRLLARGIADPAMAAHRLGQEILRAARRLQFWHWRKHSRPRGFLGPPAVTYRSKDGVSRQRSQA